MKVEIGPYPNWYAEQYELFQDEPTVSERHVRVEIDNYDIWNMDTTLAYIILPMLKMLRRDTCGAPYVDLDDVPQYLHPTPLPTDWEENKLYDADDAHFQRWDWVLDEMIFAFESKLNDELDDIYVKYGDRIQNGFRLFGKYYSALWT